VRKFADAFSHDVSLRQELTQTDLMDPLNKNAALPTPFRILGVGPFLHYGGVRFIAVRSCAQKDFRHKPALAR
jgi:hypothetical protein